MWEGGNGASGQEVLKAICDVSATCRMYLSRIWRCGLEDVFSSFERMATFVE